MRASSDKPVAISEKDVASYKGWENRQRQHSLFRSPFPHPCLCLSSEEEEIKIDKNFKLQPVSDDVIWAAKRALFETNFAAAEEILNPIALNNLWAMSVSTETSVIRFMLEKRPEQLELAVTRLRTAAAQAVVLIKRYKMKPDKKSLAKDLEKAHLLAEAMAHEAHAYMILAMILIMAESFVKGAYYTRKSWKCWETTQKVVDDLNALSSPPSEQLAAFVSFGVGFFFFGISLVPANLEFIVKILGFQGDRERASKLLRNSKDVKSCGKSVESSLMLYALQFWFSDGREMAPVVLRELQEQLPDSPLIAFMSGWQAMITDHDSDAALAQYQRGTDLVQVPQLKAIFGTSLAWCHFVREDWAEVSSLLTESLATAEPDGNHSYSSFNLAVACHMQERHDECAKLMQNVLDFEKKANNWDSYASSVARSYLESKEFDRVTLILLLAENANEAGRPEKALAYLDEADQLSAWANKSADDKLAMTCYFRGCALRLLKETDKAKSQLIRVAGMHQVSHFNSVNLLARTLMQR